ncbi:MAG: preprotein translocase subunit SecA, partial [Patescibacteria group bacterium]
EQTLDILFDAEADKFATVLRQEAGELYDNKESVFGADILREVERDIYFQVLDTLWMQHLESMEHMQQGIKWLSVGQRDPLVEYRRQAQVLYDEMQITLRREVIRALMHAQPVTEAQLNHPTETELTRAARAAVDNADQILDQQEVDEKDFKETRKKEQAVAKKKAARKKAARKKEKRNKKKSRKK